MKLDFTKADGIVEVTQTCLKCGGSGVTRLSPPAIACFFKCPDCVGRGKITTFMTPRAIREMIGEDFHD